MSDGLGTGVRAPAWSWSASWGLWSALSGLIMEDSPYQSVTGKGTPPGQSTAWNRDHSESSTTGEECPDVSDNLQTTDRWEIQSWKISWLFMTFQSFGLRFCKYLNKHGTRRQINPRGDISWENKVMVELTLPLSFYHSDGFLYMKAEGIHLGRGSKISPL